MDLSRHTSHDGISHLGLGEMFSAVESTYSLGTLRYLRLTSAPEIRRLRLLYIHRLLPLDEGISGAIGCDGAGMR